MRKDKISRKDAQWWVMEIDHQLDQRWMDDLIAHQATFIGNLETSLKNTGIGNYSNKWMLAGGCDIRYTLTSGQVNDSDEKR